MRCRLPVFFHVILALGAAFASYGCSTNRQSPEPPPAAAADSSAPADTAGSSPADRRALKVARRLIAQTDSAFQTVEPLSAAEKQRLRRYLQPQHLERARRLGLDPVRNRRTAADLAARPESSAVRLHTNDFYIIDPSMSYAVPLVIPSTKYVLERLGRRFQSALLQRGLPPYRFLLTNVLRTGQDQAALRGTNVNAAQGQSTHEYGTSFDIYYEWFHYAAVHDTLARRAYRASPADASAAPLNVELLRERLYAAYVRLGKKRARKLKAVLGRAILDLQEAGLLLAIYERQEAVFHLTVAREIEPPAHPFAPARAPDSTRPTPAARTGSAP